MRDTQGPTPGDELENTYATRRQQRSELKSAPQKKRRQRFWKVTAFFVLAIVLFTGLFYLYLRYAELPPNELANASSVVASDGSTLTDLVGGGENRLKIPLDQIPEDLIHATLAVEDQQFYHHKGFNPVGLARAMWQNVTSGEVQAGGSTITQQLVKNLFLTQEQTFTRKIKEAVITLQVEMNYTKDEILEQYLNVIYYGQGAYGVEMAAEVYFGKKASELTLAEATMLAGIPKSPNYYNPLLNADAAKQRQRVVLDLMVQEGHLTKQQADAAWQEPLHYVEAKQQKTGQAPYFTDFVQWQLANAYGINEDQVYRGGLKIETTLDPAMQQAAEAAVEKHFAALSSTSKDLQVALIAMDPKNGAIKAMVGGRNHMASSYNRVFAKRQPGSAFKPLVYLTALNNNYTPAVRIKSEKRTFEYKDAQGQERAYDVHNFNEVYVNDYLPFRDAIARSDNVFAVTTIMDVGADKVVHTAKALGIQSEMQPYPSLALGTFPASPMEMVKAYAALANGGYKVEPHAVARIEDAYEQKLIEFETDREAILDPGAAFILTDLMRSVYTDPHGTGYRVHDRFNRPVAGKTGTTDTDAWMIGYTPDLVTAVWVGYDKDRLLSPVESHVPAPIWADFMQAAHAKLPVQDFQPPGNVVEAYIDPNTGLLATENCPTKRREYFLAGTEPTDWCNEHPSMTQGGNAGAGTPGAPSSGFSSFWNWITGKSKPE